jgi:hypothetical protein
MISENGPSIVLLPSPRLKKSDLKKASSELGALASTLAISNRELKDRARNAVVDRLDQRREPNRFADVIG